MTRFKGRILLLLCLAPLLALYYPLLGVPLTYSHGYSPNLWCLNSNRTAAYFGIGSNMGPETRPGTKQWEQKISIDLATGRLTRLSDDQYVVPQHAEFEIATRAITRLDSMDAYWNSQYKEWQVLDLDPKSRKFVPGKQFDFPVQGQLAGDRFVVGIDNKQVLSLDLDNPNSTIQTNACPSATPKSYLSTVPHSPRFVVIHDYLPAGFTVNPTKIPKHIELFEIDTLGAPTLLNSWSLEVGQRNRVGQWSYAIVNDEIATLESSPNRIEFHSLKDGALSHTDLLPNEIESSNIGTKQKTDFEWMFRYQRLFIQQPSGTAVFDCRTRNWYAKLEPDCRAIDELAEENLLLLVKSGDRKNLREHTIDVYDCGLQKSLGSFKSEEARIYKLVDGETVAALGALDGYSVDVIKFRTGEVTHQWRPLGWVVPVTAILLIGYAVWAVAWMIVSAREGGKAWIDAAIVGGLLVAALTARILSIGGPPSFMRMPFWFGMGIFLAALMIAECYLILGKSRLSLRVVPFLVVLATLFAILSLAFEQDPRWAWMGLATMSLPLGIMLGVALLLRLCRFRLTKISNDEVEVNNTTASQSTSPRISDLFLVLTSVAMLVAASRPILGWWGASWNAITIYYETFAIVLFALLAGACALSRRRWLYAVGCLLAAVATIYLPTPWLMEFSTQGSGYPFRLASRSWGVEVTLSCAVAFFVFCIPYRLRGLRIPF